MFQNKVVIFGDGLLGSTIKRLTDWDIVSRKQDGVDINKRETYRDVFLYYQEILNCVGYTDTYSQDKSQHWQTNYLGLMKLVHFTNRFRQKLIHISSDYIYANSKHPASENDPPSNAPNWYSYTKLLGDAYVQAMSVNYLLIRTSFKPKPFPYQKALTCQTGNFDYVDVIASKIIELIEKDATGIFNVGTETKTIYDLALETNSSVQKMDQRIHATMPTNITMDISKMKKFLEN